MSEALNQIFGDRFTYKNALNCVAVLIGILASIDYDRREMEWLNSVREFGRFETIVTPSDKTFFMTQIIVIANCAFCFAQMLPSYSKSEILQDGVSYWFFVATIVQIIAAACFSHESFIGFIFSTLFIGVVVGCFMKILAAQASASVCGDELQHTPEEYWLLRFPFSLQAGWYICILISSVNNIFVRLEYSPLFQVILAVVCFLLFAGIALKMLMFNGPNPNYVIPAVIFVYTLGIAFDFQEPGVEDDFGGAVVIFLMCLISIVSLGVGVGTAYLLYNNELKEAGGEAAEADGNYHGAEMVPSTSNANKTNAGGDKDSFADDGKNAVV